MIFYLLFFFKTKFIRSSPFYKSKTNNDVLNECDTKTYETLTSNFNIPISNEDLEDYLKFLDRIIEPSNHNNAKNIGDTDLQENHLNLNFYNYLEEVYHVIKYNICNLRCDRFFRSYITRLDLIKETLLSLRESYRFGEEIFSQDYDVDFFIIIDYLKSKYSNILSIDNQLYEYFSIDLDQKIRELQDHNYVKYKILQQNINKGTNLHLKEFMKMYKYIKLFPELLCLSFASTQSCLKKATIIFHLLVLFLSKNESNLVNQRQIVMLLLKKAFTQSLRQKLDFIFILQLQESNTEDRSQLFFFCCEFNNNYRKKIKNRIYYRNDPNLFFIEEDRVHYNIVLYLFLFQHMIYLKYKNVKNTEFEEFKQFFNQILQEKGCYKNQFYNFLKMIN